MDRRRLLTISGAAALASGCGIPLVASGGAWAAEGTLTLIVPGPGGSRSGVAGRILGTALQKELGRPVEAIPVDSPREGYMMLAAAPANGNTFGLIGADMPALNRGIGGSPAVSSISPVALMSEDPAGIHVRRDAPWRNARELVASLRSGTGRLKASGAGKHAVWHLSTQRWLMAARSGAPLAWEAAANPAEAAEALAAGGPDIVVCSVPEIRASPAARQIRTLAVMSPSRNSRYPEIAALGESGVALRAGWWRGVAGPRGLDQAQVTRMQAALQRVQASPAYRQEMARRGFSMVWGGSGQFARFIASEDAAMAAAIRGIG